MPYQNRVETVSRDSYNVNSILETPPSEHLGRLHSLESLSTCDGPGLRQVIFLQGCSLRCRFCHNPDSWNPQAGQLCSAQYLYEKIDRFRNYAPGKSGVTISGGEPLYQPDFLLKLLSGFKNRGFHTALDTAGWPYTEKNDCLLKAILAQTDLLLLDIKDPDPGQFLTLTGAEPVGRDYLIRLAIAAKTPVWLRYVVLPGFNDNNQSIHVLSEWVYRQFNLGLNIENMTLLPYHKLGTHKYAEADIDYSLDYMPALTEEQLLRFKHLLKDKMTGIFRSLPFDLS